MRCRVPLELAEVRNYSLRTVSVLNPDVFQQLLTCVEKDVCIHLSVMYIYLYVYICKTGTEDLSLISWGCG